MVYSNLISVSQAWVRQDKLPFELGIWGVHAVMFGLLLALFWHRLTLVKWWRLWR
jgi:lipopolysaccharide export system permease protein